MKDIFEDGTSDLIFITIMTDTDPLNQLLSDENTNKNQMDSMKVDIKRAQNQFTTKSYLLVFGRY